jgi:uncharacterized protein YkwD
MLGAMARKAVALALLALCTAIGMFTRGVAPATADGCPNADSPAAQLSLRDFDASVFCLINQRRAEVGLQPLHPNQLLRHAAWGYTNALMRGRFFSHYGDFAGHQNASTPVGRLLQIGYVRRGYVWIVGEDLRWSTPETSSPGQVVEFWMESPIHRMYLLKAKFDELGVAGTRGTPIDPNLPDGITVAAEFGFRRG